MAKHIEKVSIALQPNVYTLFRHLNNTPSNTIAEFVDNSVQSYLNNKRKLNDLHKDYHLTIQITFDWEHQTIEIMDNAGGIDETNYVRAFEPANIPTDATGLNEYGIGMKTASIWLADKWKVVTKALGEPYERTVEFDLDQVTREQREELNVREFESDVNDHYTHILLTRLSNNAPSVNQVPKIKSHLSSMYRKYIRSGEVEIIVNDSVLEAPNYEFLSAPYYKGDNNKKIVWKKKVDVHIGNYRAKGYIGILKNIKNGANGLVLMRRGRVIAGDGDERFFPKGIFSSPGTFRYKRLFGELELEGFRVSFNKNRFQDTDNLEALFDLIKDELKSDEMNLLSMADNYRERSKEDFQKISNTVSQALSKNISKTVAPQTISDITKEAEKEQTERKKDRIDKAVSLGENTESITINNVVYQLTIATVTTPESDKMYTLIQEKGGDKRIKKVTCKVNLAHAFFKKFSTLKNGDDYMPVIAIVRALALAELSSTAQSITSPSYIRILFNKYLAL